jgi:hypothetical protein
MSAVPSSNPARRRLLSGIAVLFVFLPIAHGLPPGDAGDAPVIRRIVLPADRIPQEMERVRQGVLRQMPREEFEELVRKATAPKEAVRTPPRLVGAHYRARLENNALVGAAEWKMRNPLPSTGDDPALLPLHPFNLALSRPRLEGHDALIAAFDGKSFGLLLDGGGEQTLTFDWSSRAEPTPAGLHFDLQTPSCAVATLELTLPADCRLRAPAETCVVSGPRAANAAQHRLWTIGFAGQAQLTFTVEQTQNPGTPPPLLLYALRSRQELSPDHVRAEFEISLEALHQPLETLLLACDPTLEPFDVESPSLAGWQFRRARVPGVWNTLALQFHEPLTSGLLRVRALARLKTAAAERREEARPTNGGSAKTVAPLWRSPAIRVLDSVRPGMLSTLSGLPLSGGIAEFPWGPFACASLVNEPRPFQIVPRGETLVLRIHPDLETADWQPGPFRLSHVVTGADGWEERTLVGGGMAAQPARPSARMHMPPADFRVHQLLWWQVGPDESSLTAQFTYEITRGRLFQLPFLLPANWDVVQVETTPADRLRGWTRSGEGSETRLIVDLSRPLTPGPETTASLRLTATLRPRRGAGLPNTTVAAVPFPDIVPLGARVREGGLAIEFDEQAYLPVVTASAPAALAEEPGPWGRQLPDLYFAYRGQPVRGTLRLQPVQARLRARTETEVTLTSTRATVLTRLRVAPEAGTPDTVDMTFSAPVPNRWTWKTASGGNAIRRLERLPLAPALSPPGLAGFGVIADWARRFTLAPTGEVWRITFAAPVREPVTLEMMFEFERPPSGEQLPIPLPLFLHVVQQEGEVRLDSSSVDGMNVQSVGLRAAPSKSRAGAERAARNFRYTSAPVSLVISGPSLPTDHTGDAVVERARLTTIVQQSGPLLHRFRFDLRAWREGMPFLVRLPAAARPLAVQIDGYWLAQLPDSGPGADAGENAVERTIELPVPPAPAAHAYELVYATPAASWTLWTTLAPPPGPALPVQPRSLRRTWVLPSGVAPLREESLRPLPGLGNPETGGLLAAVPQLRPFSPWDAAGLESQRQAVYDGGVAIANRRSEKPLSLGDALDHLVFENLRDEPPLVLDATGLRAAGLGPHTPLPHKSGTSAGTALMPFWESVGLTYVPCSEAPLLTTEQELRSWRSTYGTAPLVGSLANAVGEARRFGHDSSGRFRTVPDWLRSEARVARTADPAVTNGPLAETPTADGTEWEALTGSEAGAPLLVVRTDRVPLVAAAIGMIPVAWFLVRRGRLSITKKPADERSYARASFVVLWLTVAVLAHLWLPTSVRNGVVWPACVAALAVIADALLTGLPRSAASTGLARMSAVGLVVALGAVGRAAPAAGPSLTSRSATVYLLAGRSETPDKQMVLLSPELLDQLRALGRRGVTLPGSVLLGADYRASVRDGFADIEAVYSLQTFVESAAFLLPLDGVDLLDGALLDGTKAFPVALPPPQTGYTVRITGPVGVHVLRVPFRVSIQGTGEERDLRFLIPQTPQCRATVTAPGHVRQLQSLVGRGVQHVTHSDAAQRLDADLGRTVAETSRLIGPLHVRWREAVAASAKSQPEYNEAYLWTLRPNQSELRGVVQYHLGQASVDELAFDLPEDLALRQVEATRLADGTPLRLQQTDLVHAAGKRQFRLVFQTAVSGSVQVSFDLIPLKPLSERSFLTLPVPRGTPAKDGGLLAYRLERLDAKVVDNLLVTSVPLERFSTFWRSAGMTESLDPASFAGGAYAFQRKSGVTPQLQLELRQQLPRSTATQELLWRINSQRADVQARVRLTCPDSDVGLIEWEVPAAVQIGEIRGRDVRAWSRTGARVRIWLQQTLPTTDFQLLGWLPLSGDVSPDPRRSAIDTRFELPCLSFINVREQLTSVSIRASSTIAVETEALRGLVPRAIGEAASALANPWSALAAPLILGSSRAPTEPMFVTRQSRYGGVLSVRSAIPDQARVLCVAETVGRRIAFHAAIDCRVRKGELRALAVRVRNADGAEVKLDAPQLAQQRELRADKRGRLWALDLKPGVGDHYQFTLAADFSIDAGGSGLQMPDVSIEEVDQTERWVAIAGRDLQVENAAGLLPLRETASALTVWPLQWRTEAERIRRTGGLIWQATSRDWRLRLLPTSVAVDQKPVRILLTQHAATVANGKSWLHEGVFWLYQDAQAELQFTLPEHARLLTAELDGDEVRPVQSQPETHTLTLAAAPGPRLLRLRWVVQEETFSAPNLETPRFGGLSFERQLWTLHVPAGFEVTAAPGTERMPSAEQDLAEAEAYLHLSEVLAEREKGHSASADVRAAQERFYVACRLADYAITAALRDESPASPVAPLAESLRQLRVANGQLARSHGFESLRNQAEKQARTPVGVAGEGAPQSRELDTSLPWAGGAVIERGRPTFWRTVDGAPQLRLISDADYLNRRSMAVTLVLCVVLLTGGSLSLLAPSRRVMSALWPEAAALFGVLIWFETGPGWIAMLFVLVGMFSRVACVGRGVVSFFSRPTARATTPIPAKS